MRLTLYGGQWSWRLPNHNPVVLHGVAAKYSKSWAGLRLARSSQ